MVCAVWITFYPVARLRRSEPWLRVPQILTAPFPEILAALS
jgi:hypothetical protein